MATKNWGLQVPTKSTPLTPLATPFALLASSISDALTSILSGTAKKGTPAQRDAFYGTPTTSATQLALQGATWYNTTGQVEQVYRAAYNATTNPLGMSSAGWYNAGAPADTGWQAITSTADGYVAAGAYWRRIGSALYLRGQINPPGSAWPNASVVGAAVIPANVAPSAGTGWAAVGSGNAVTKGVVQSNGSIDIAAFPNGSTYLRLDGCSILAN